MAWGTQDESSRWDDITDDELDVVMRGPDKHRKETPPPPVNQDGQYGFPPEDMGLEPPSDHRERVV